MVAFGSAAVRTAASERKAPGNEGGSTGAAGQEPRAGRGGAGTKGVEERIAELGALVGGLRAELEALRATATGTAAGAGGPATLQELERKIEALAQEIERLRIGEAAAPPAQEPVPGFGPAASKVYAIKRGVSVGGYGEMLYQNIDARREIGRAHV